MKKSIETNSGILNEKAIREEVDALKQCIIDGSCYDVPGCYLTRKQIEYYNKQFKKDGIELIIEPFFEYIYPEKDQLDLGRLEQFEKRKIKNKFSTEEKKFYYIHQDEINNNQSGDDENDKEKKVENVNNNKKNKKFFHDDLDSNGENNDNDEEEKIENQNQSSKSTFLNKKKNNPNLLLSKDHENSKNKNGILQKISSAQSTERYNSLFDKIKNQKNENENETNKINSLIEEIKELSKDLTIKELKDFCSSHKLSTIENEIKLSELKEKSLPQLENIKESLFQDITFHKLYNKRDKTIRTEIELEQKMRQRLYKKAMRQENKRANEQLRLLKKIREGEKNNDDENYFRSQFSEEVIFGERRDMNMNGNERNEDGKKMEVEEESKSEESLSNSLED